MVSPLPNPRQLTIQALRRSIGRRFAGGEAELRSTGALSSTGIESLDALLPEQGFLPGTVCEWKSPPGGTGACSLLLRSLRDAMTRHPSSQVAVFTRRGQFCAEAFALAGVDLSRVIVLRPRDRSEWLWSLEQTLRCPGVLATVSERPHCSSIESRRLKVAAERGGGLGLFFQQAQGVPNEPGVDVRFEVTPVLKTSAASDRIKSRIHEPIVLAFPQEGRRAEPDTTKVPFSVDRRLRVELLACRGAVTGASVLLETCDETGAVRETSHLASATGAAGTHWGKQGTSGSGKPTVYERAG